MHAVDSMPTAPSRLAPIPPMPHVYSTTGKRDWLQSIFDQTAGDYDRMERWLSLGSGKWYRRQALRRAGLVSGMNVLDVATGTGIVAREAIAIVGSSGGVCGIDPSEGMLDLARARLPIRAVVACAESLPFPAASFDFLCMGYALRHVDDVGVAFAEFARVLKPGGRVCILEITRPANALGRAALRAYMTAVIGVAGRLGAKSRRTLELWHYYGETIDQCVPPSAVVEAMRAAGFSDARREATFGVFSEYVGRRDSMTLDHTPAIA